MPRPIPRPAKPEVHRIKDSSLAEQASNFAIMGAVRDAMVSTVVFRTGDDPFDQDAPAPLFPLYLYSYAPRG